MSRSVAEQCTIRIRVVEGGGFLQSLNPFHKYTWQWQADAIGPEGTYLAAWSSTFKCIGTTQTTGNGSMPASMGGWPAEYLSTRDEIISILLADGWQPMNNRFHDPSFTRTIWI
jgi:hypothetical protein